MSARLGGIVASQRDAGQPGVRELSRHVARVLFRHAEAECAHRSRVEDDASDRLEEFGDTQIIVREQIAELLWCVAATSPSELAEVRSVCDAEVLEGDEKALVYGFPEAKLDRDSLIKPLRYVLPIESLGRSGET